MAIMHITKNDTVMVMAGDDRGKTGKVLKVFPDTERVIIEKVNFVKRHKRPTQKTTAGGIHEKEAPVHVSNVQLVCPKCGKAVRVGSRKLEDGSRERFCRSCDETISRAGL